MPNDEYWKDKRVTWRDILADIIVVLVVWGAMLTLSGLARQADQPTMLRQAELHELELR